MGPGDVDKVLAVGGEGVGLYRTEFLFMDRDKARTKKSNTWPTAP
jgi:phosphotransferase system enzyme I (PtsI)